MDFSCISGQKDIIGRLEYSLANDRVGHAYIFTGPRGIGKRTVARIFLSILLCERPNKAASCGQCLPCRLFDAGTNPDFYEIKTDNPSIGVDDIRKMQDHIAIRPFYSRGKAYLIPDADKMTVQAQNCLLKTLEEPPGFAVIILTASNPDSLIETVRSRAVRYSFKRNTFEEVKNHLKRKYNNTLEEIDLLVSYSDGIIGKAEELAENRTFASLRENAIGMLLKIKKAGFCDITEISDFFNSNKAYVDTLLDIMASFYRDMLIVKNTHKENVLINTDKKDIILDNVNSFTIRELMRNIETVEFTRMNVRKNVNFQMSMDVMIARLWEERNKW